VRCWIKASCCLLTHGLLLALTLGRASSAADLAVCSRGTGSGALGVITSLERNSCAGGCELMRLQSLGRPGSTWLINKTEGESHFNRLWEAFRIAYSKGLGFRTILRLRTSPVPSVRPRILPLPWCEQAPWPCPTRLCLLQLLGKRRVLHKGHAVGCVWVACRRVCGEGCGTGWQRWLCWLRWWGTDRWDQAWWAESAIPVVRLPASWLSGQHMSLWHCSRPAFASCFVIFSDIPRIPGKETSVFC